MKSLPIPQILGAESPQVHSGFLLGAKALAERVKEQLDISESGRGPTQILFTGHSAGAAVASLLFQHFLSSASVKCEFLDAVRLVYCQQL